MDVVTLPSRAQQVLAPPLVPERKPLTVCIFCGAAAGKRKVFEEQTRTAVRVLVSQGHRIVYGGAKNGLMGVMADEAIRLGGTVVGVIPALLVDKELIHKGLNEIHVVASMHERKKKMSDLADASSRFRGELERLRKTLSNGPGRSSASTPSRVACSISTDILRR